MKKLLLLFLLVAGGVSTASAWGDMYLLCNENHKWGYDNESEFKFTRITDNQFRATVPGSYINSGAWYFRFREKDSKTWFNICPQGNSADAEITSTAVSTNTGNPSGATAKAFYISKNDQAKYVQIFCTWNTSTSKWDITCSVITSVSSYSIAFTNPDTWTSDNVKVHAFVDGIALIDNGSWPGRTMSYDSNNGLYTATITNVIPNSNIKFSNNGDNQTDALALVDDAIYTKTSTIADQEIAINSYGMATYCSQYPLDFSTATVTDGEGTLKAYTITGNNPATGVLTKSEVNKVPTGTGVYIEGTAGKSFTVKPTATASSISTNMLVGVTSSTAIAQTVNISETNYTNYILTVNRAVGGNADTPKFFKVNSEGNTVSANRAYLQIPTASAARESFWFDAETTAIESLTPALNEGAVYDLQGRRVAQPTKGLYIVNGKKVIK